MLLGKGSYGGFLREVLRYRQHGFGLGGLRHEAPVVRLAPVMMGSLRMLMAYQRIDTDAVRLYRNYTTIQVV